MSLLIGLCACLLSSCGDAGSPSSLEDFQSRPVTLPDGTVIKAEVLYKPADMARGAMFRDSLPEGQGLLFLHRTPGRYSYWMFQVKIPLDIIWMDPKGRVVEVSENTPPCPGQASTCGNYGGTVDSAIVLEVPGGYARKHGIAKGEIIRF